MKNKNRGERWRALVLPDNCGMWMVAVFAGGVWQSSSPGLTREEAQQRAKKFNARGVEHYPLGDERLSKREE